MSENYKNRFGICIVKRQAEWYSTTKRPGDEKMKILNFGSLNLDYVYDVAEFVKGGQTISAYGLAQSIGGKGLNQSIALARAGAQVWHAGCVGADGRFLVNFLAENGVSTECIRTVDAPTGHAMIQVDTTGQNCIIIFGGANNGITEAHINDTLNWFSAEDVLLLQNEINNVRYIAEKAREKGMTVILNPSPVTNLDVPLELVDMFILNELEAAEIFGKESTEDQLRAMREACPQAKFVLTLGEQGAIYMDAEQTVHVDAVKANAVDTTAAGDTFTGYFLTSYLAGDSIERALRTAAKAAAITVSRKGASPSIPHKSKVL